MTEVAKNVHVTDTVVTDLLEDPRKWLDGLDGFEIRYVGGIHNLSANDKKAWVRGAKDPLRIIETGTGREEVWFPLNSKAPEYISIDQDGNLTSHAKYDVPQPTMVRDIRLASLDGVSEDIHVAFSLWYQGEHIHRPDSGPAVLSSKVRIAVPDDEYIAGIAFNVFREFWLDGAWQATTADDMTLIFKKRRLNGPEIQQQVTEWIGENCQGGFFPLSDTLFGDPEEEFMFLTDICSQG